MATDNSANVSYFPTECSTILLDNLPPIHWLGFTGDTTEEIARGVFARRYGVTPETVKRTGGAVLVGPVPEQVG